MSDNTLSTDTSGIWTGLLKWSLAQPNYGTESARPLDDEERTFLSKVFDSIVIDEIKRMKLIISILQIPHHEEELRRVVNESSQILEKLKEVSLPQSELEHYGGSSNETSNSTTTDEKTQEMTNSTTNTNQITSSSTLTSSSTSTESSNTDYRSVSLASLRDEVLRRKEGALDELDDRVVVSDMANDFLKLGGIEPLLASIRSGIPSLQWRAAQALSTIVQNNAPTQKQIFDTTTALTDLVNLLTISTNSMSSAATSNSSSASSSSDNESLITERWNVVVKALTALSALIRCDDHPEIRTSFFRDHDGVTNLCRLLLHTHSSSSSSRAVTKVFLLLSLLMRWFPNEVKEQLNSNSIVPYVITHYFQRFTTETSTPSSSTDRNLCESIVRFLSTYLELKENEEKSSHQRRLNDVSSSTNLNLRDLIAARFRVIDSNVRQHGESKDGYEEEIRLLESMAQVLPLSSTAA